MSYTDLSFPNLRDQLIGMGGVGPASGPSSGMGLSQMTAGGGMDPMASLRANQLYGTRFQSNPTGGGGGFHPFSTGPMSYGG